jgi:predicted MFS family arabinose efflux permease
VTGLRRLVGPGRRDFTLLWVGQAASQLGSRTYGVAYMLWALAETGSAAVLGLTGTATLAAFAAAQLPGGWLVDRFDRRRVMVAADAVAAVAALSLAAVAASGGFALAHLLVAAVLLGACWAVRPAAEFAALPRLVGADEVPDAFALVQARAYATGLAGPLLAGLLFGWAPWLPFLLDGLSYVVAGTCAALVRTPLGPVGPGGPGAAPAGSPLADVRAGLREFWRHRFVRATAALGALAALGTGGVGLVVIVLLGEGAAESSTTGLVLALGGAAGLGGALLTPAVRHRVRVGPLLVAAPLVSAVAVALLPLPSGPVALGLVYAAVFLLQPAWEAVVESRWVTLVPDEFRGRVQSAAGLLVAVPMAATPALVGALLELTGPAVTTAVLAGVLGTVAVGAAVVARVVPEPVVAAA